ncbi:accessory factor UbiK family protein [Thermaurantiacus sp.]
MQKENQLLEDIARLLSSVTGTIAGAGREAEVRFRERLREAIGGLDHVSREEFEAVKAMAREARAEVAALKAELAATRGAATSPRRGRRKSADDS